MSQNKPVIHKMITPKATFIWPRLTEPDYGSKDFPKPDGEYSTKLQFDASDPEFQKFRAKVEKLHAAAIEKAEAEFAELKVAQRKKLGQITINPAFTDLYDEETEEPTGMVEMKCKMKASGEIKKGPKAGKKWSRAPQLFDAQGTPIKTKGLAIGGGTIGKISVSVKDGGYFIPGSGAAGISFQLEAAQIIELVQFGQRSASDHGFGAEEGFSADDIVDAAAEKDEFDDAGTGAGTGGSTEDEEPEGAADF